MSRQAICLNDYSTDLLDEIRLSGISPQDCYQCGRCSSGCPIQPHFDIKTMEVVKLSALGMEGPLMKSHAIWLCAGCETCTTRCPNDIDIAGLMDVLRQYSLRKGYKPTEPRIAAFHKTYLEVIRRWGRIFEVELFSIYKMRSRDFFGDLGMGLKMFLQGKLGILPHRTRDRAAVRRIYRDARKAEGVPLAGSTRSSAPVQPADTAHPSDNAGTPAGSKRRKRADDGKGQGSR